MSIFIETSKDPLRIVSRGHATGAGLAGSNLVCCAVSTLLYTLLSAADGKGMVAGLSVADGYMDLRLEPGAGREAEADCMVETVLSGLESLASQYPAWITLRRGKDPVPAGAESRERTE